MDEKKKIEEIPTVGTISLLPSWEGMAGWLRGFGVPPEIVAEFSRLGRIADGNDRRYEIVERRKPRTKTDPGAAEADAVMSRGMA